MNYYALWISFPDNSNLFYNPGPSELVRLSEGTKMPVEFFFTLPYLDKHKEIVERLCKLNCSAHRATFHCSKIRMGDTDWESIYRFRHPPPYPGGFPEASSEDAPDKSGVEFEDPRFPW